MLRRIAFVTFLVALYSGSLFTTNGCGGDPVQVETVLHGSVTDAETGRPIAGVDVAVQSVGATTGADGAYLVPRLSPGRVTVVFSHPDYRTVERAVDLRQGTNNLVVQLTRR